MKKIILIHGWGGSPETNWFPWLKKELEQKGFEVIAPEMPNTDEPKIEEWVPFLIKQFPKLDENIFLVGHSMGCQAIMRGLEKIKGKAEGIVFVAPFFHLQGMEEEEGSEEIAKPWIETPINFKKIKAKIKRLITIFSNDDHSVPLSDSDIFREKLGAKVMIEQGKGHFVDSNYPVILKAIIEISST